MCVLCYIRGTHSDLLKEFVSYSTNNTCCWLSHTQRNTQTDRVSCGDTWKTRRVIHWILTTEIRDCLFLALCVDSSAPLSGSLYISLTLSFLCICADLVIYFFERHLRTVFFARFVFCHFDLEGKWNGRLRLYVWAAALWSLIIPNTSKRIPRDDADLIHDPM